VSDNIKTRPRWHHNDVKAATALLYVEEIRTWASLYGAVADDANPREFLACVTLAMQESVDAYQAGRYFDDFFDWPVAGDLIAILDRCYARMHFVAKDMTRNWVMNTATRFPAKVGDIVKCKIGEVDLVGEVIEVISTTSSGILHLNGNGKILNVEAEEVVQVVSTKEERAVPSNKKGK
jgi:hypothetical protein